MALWTLIGLAEGSASTSWPFGTGPDGQEGVIGMPHLDHTKCATGCTACIEACPTGAIMLNAAEPVLDYG